MLCLAGAAATMLLPGDAQAPPRGASRASAPEPTLSSIVLPIELPLDQLAKFAQDQIPESLIEIEGEALRDGWLTDLKAQRTGPVTAQGEDGVLVIGFPMTLDSSTYSAEVAKKRAQQGKPPPAGIGVSFEANIRFQTVPTLSKTWSMSTDSAIFIDWTKPPVLKIGPVKLPIRNVMDRALKGPLANVAREVDANLAERDTLRASMQHSWDTLWTPVQMSPDPPTWLVLEPTGLFASNPEVKRKNIKFDAGVQGYFSAVVGDIATPGATPKLPNRAAPPVASGLSISVPVALDWDVLSQQANALLTSSSWTDETTGTTLFVDEIELYPSRSAIAIRLDYRAETSAWNTDGTVYLTGVPTLDARGRRVRIDRFDYGLATWDLAVGAASAIAESGLEAALVERLDFDVGPRLDAATSQANQALKAGAGEDGRIEGQLNVVELTDVRLTNQALVVDTRVSGALTMILEPPAKLTGRRPTQTDNPSRVK
jgi:hypothetical protein